jgi:type II secretory pathway component PulF
MKQKKHSPRGISVFSRMLIRSEERMFFLEHLSLLLGAGMDVVHILESVQKDARSYGMRRLIAHIKDDVNSGVSLWRAFENTHAMPQHVVSLIRIGEQSGRLSANLDVIVLQQQKEHEFRSRVRSAMMYPVFVLMLAFVIGIGIAWFILPRLADVFDELDVALPLITRVLIAIGAFFSEYGSTAIPVFLGLMFFLVIILFVVHPTRFIGQWMLMRLPGVKKLILEIELSRLGYLLGTLLDAGLPIIEALESLTEATTVAPYKRLYHFLQVNVNEGQSLRSSFAAYRRASHLIPNSIQQLLVAGEQSGRLAQILLKIGRTFEEKTETSTKNLAVILEPILLVIVWIGVVLVALAVVLPVYSLIGNLQA